jgi:hypothetical protein
MAPDLSTMLGWLTGRRLELHLFNSQWGPIHILTSLIAGFANMMGYTWFQSDPRDLPFCAKFIGILESCEKALIRRSASRFH